MASIVNAHALHHHSRHNHSLSRLSSLNCSWSTDDGAWPSSWVAGALPEDIIRKPRGPTDPVRSVDSGNCCVPPGVCCASFSLSFLPPLHEYTDDIRFPYKGCSRSLTR